jgi:hypothetical protein
MRDLPGFSPMRLALVLTVSFFVVVLAVAVVATRSSGTDAQPASKTTPSGSERVKVVIAGTNDALEEQTDGGIAGEGTFRATGAINDSGSVRAYRAVPNKNLILLRFVSKGKKGTITYLVAIHIKRLPPISRWKIESATKAYKGLQGEGNESENATYTTSYLIGTVWR